MSVDPEATDQPGSPDRPGGVPGWATAVIVAVAVLWAVLLAALPIGGVLGAALLTAVALGATAVAVARRHELAWTIGRDTWLALPVVGIHLLASHLLVPAATALVPLVGRQADELVFTATSDLAPIVVALVAGLVVAPLEELWWRATLQSILREGRSPWRAVAMTTAAFVAFHLPTGQLPLIGAAVLGGIAWGWLRERTGGVLAPMLAHAGWTAGMVLVPPG